MFIMALDVETGGYDKLKVIDLKSNSWKDKASVLAWFLLRISL